MIESTCMQTTCLHVGVACMESLATRPATTSIAQGHCGQCGGHCCSLRGRPTDPPTDHDHQSVSISALHLGFMARTARPSIDRLQYYRLYNVYNDVPGTMHVSVCVRWHTHSVDLGRAWMGQMSSSARALAGRAGQKSMACMLNC